MAALRSADPQKYREHRSRGAERDRLSRNADADDTTGRIVEGERALRGLWAGNAAHHRSARARNALRPHQRRADYRDNPLDGQMLSTFAEGDLLYSMEIPLRDQAAIRRDARPRIPYEGRLFL